MVKNRLRLTWEGAWLTAGCLIFVIAGIAMIIEGTTTSVVLGIVAVVLFGGGGLLAASRVLSRRPVLEMDDSGVCVTVPWPRSHADDHRLDWDELAGITAYTERIEHRGACVRHHYLAFVPRSRAESAAVDSGSSDSAERSGASVECPWELRYATHIRSTWDHSPEEVVAQARRHRPDLPFTDRRDTSSPSSGGDSPVRRGASGG
ncbi:hypothetical protein SAMN02745673_03267 [Marinactinospora thermotolerans DSM 45154]|uniref:Uncharacterized protein n=1 Tax=Marinactinospora thermotolerans DSM 45154 TaxID=1122192 RepID=A0A1T4S6S6_9ACTN|nr:hypothetical protein SAMN02745673_03267 [Marinactinospora thermotolerans DSM 45154]